MEPSKTAPATPTDNFAATFASHAKKTPTKRVNFNKMRKPLLIILGVFVVLGLIAGIVGFSLYQQVRAIKTDVDDLSLTGREAYDAIKTQNLPLAGEKLTQVTEKTKKVEAKVKGFAWTKALPIAGAYYRDSEHGFAAAYAGLSAAQKAVKEIEPYADVLGFKGQGSFTGGSAEQRIATLLETLSKVSPAIDSISLDLKTVNDNLSKIDEKKYPETFQGKALRPRIATAKQVSKDAYTFLSENRQAVELLPEAAGSTKRRKYLVIFQNSGELRPTGGFMTAYAVINVDKGKVEPEASGDIYDLDQRFTNKPPIPAILKRFLTTESRWNLRDMNLSPDYKESMTTFNQYYQTIKGQKAEFDGIIAVDTHFLESLLSVLGPVEVPGYGTFTAETDKRCDCPQIIYALSEIIDRPTPYIRENRKGILGPMMASILRKSYSAPKNLWPALFQTFWKDIEGKHVQLYFLDPKLQAAAETINAAGRVKPTQEGSDYFLLVDTNLAGAKSNFFVQSEALHVIDVPVDGKVKHTVTVSYKNPFKASNCNLEAGQLCLNGVLQNWSRVYLPSGATLVSSRGFDEGSVKQSEELGHAMVEGTFKLQPLSQAKIELVYTVPYSNNSNYVITFQKQGGTKDIKHIVEVNGEEHDVLLDKDKTVTFNW